MKKSDWLIALFFMAIGLLCLIVSASYYRTDSFSSGFRIFNSACIWMAIMGIIIYLIYRFVRFKHGKGKKG
ncbi:hypothetical protein [Brevibacillus laterosporus]|uniref:Uncharacterized protein n=1 Tax=Brevibacillus laterosporus TaxID=1465 RepID=A0AAP3DKV1_BRELA|nr:hypothetical protein [Brevibacillus laterosporus]MCR8982525.1 hypothetical protein [Brevibacillus laterosporus]MCZ0809681.1 hypothetical protein [Brevibacillus laterosporus]MCZ0828214.1 hypothetical protein [Brevibacillus laterosporus]MCZ0852236.1 hypothetical protein [Brevibacillus laterosporus]